MSTVVECWFCSGNGYKLEPDYEESIFSKQFNVPFSSKTYKKPCKYCGGKRFIISKTNKERREPVGKSGSQ